MSNKFHKTSERKLAAIYAADVVGYSKLVQEDETAMRLLRLLSIVSRRRWPKEADPAPAIGVPPPKKKKAPSPVLFVSIITALGVCILGSSTAYILSRYQFMGSKTVFMVFLAFR